MEKLPVRFSDIRPGFVDTDLLDKSKKYPMMLTAEQTADYILKGLRRKRRMIIFSWPFSLITFFWRLLPRPLWERMTFISN
jgi:short-subunit dehydrogenase